MKGCSGTILPAVSVALVLLALFSGCSVPDQPESNATMPAGDEPGTGIQPSLTATEPPVPLQTTPSQEITRIEPVMVTTMRTSSGSGTVLLDDTYSLTIREYKEYPFSDLGYDFLYDGDRFQVSIQSEKPVIVYVVNYMDSIRIQAPDNAPRYETGVTKIRWGDVAPVFSWERATDRIGTFAIGDIGKYSLVIDPRWMLYDGDWKTNRPFTYRLRITKL